MSRQKPVDLPFVWCQMNDPLKLPDGKQRRKNFSNSKQNAPSASETSTFQDLCAEGPSIWLKIAGGALATPCAVLWGLARANRRGGVAMPSDPVVLAVVVVCSIAAGAVLGAALSLKDVVEARLQTEKPVALPLKLLFGLGFRSLLLWIPIAMFSALAFAILSS